MSTIYNLEPPTRGKVIIHTTLGDLDIELWPKEAPKAVRNFIQLCLEGYYDDTIFHRVIRDYMAQCGDPTGTGTATDTVYGTPFKDEFHQRLKFSHRGLVACANQNIPNSNSSQFFVTLDKCDWLDKKNTIFGKVVGDTIFNISRFNDIDIDTETDRPTQPPSITSVEVLSNPFEDIVPRSQPGALQRMQEEEDRLRLKAEAKAAQAPKKKNLALLSFGEDAEGDEEQETATVTFKHKVRAAHDALQDPTLVRGEDTPMEERITIEAHAAKRSRTQAEQEQDAEASAAALQRTREVLAGRTGRAAVKADAEGEGDEEGGDAFSARMRARVADTRARLQVDGEAKLGEGPSARPVPVDRIVEEEAEQRPEPSVRDTAREVRERRAEELDAIKSGKRAYGKLQAAATSEVVDEQLLKPWQVAREKYKQRKRTTGGREKETLARLAAFTTKLRDAGGDEGSEGEKAAEEERAEAAGDSKKQGSGSSAVAPEETAVGEAGYSGKVDKNIDHKAFMPAAWRVDEYLEGEMDDVSVADLRKHKLTFKQPGRLDPMAYTPNMDSYEVFDPLLEKAKGKYSKAAQLEKKRANEWAGKSNV